jgi:hypothetical protein
VQVVAYEVGDRPALLTKARMFAPQAAQAFAVALETQDWGHRAEVVIDWSGTIAFDGPPPPEALDKLLPVMYLQVIRAEPSMGGTLRVEQRLDIDDLFGGDNFTVTDVENIVAEMKRTVLDELERKGKELHS